MLQSPDPADWLNWRRTLDGWGYSTLDQINTNNAHQLQLAWAWQMGSGVNGPLRLSTTASCIFPIPAVVQALDGATGDRFWEYQREFDELTESVLSPRSRSIAIYDDKIYMNTADAHIVAPARRVDRRGRVGPGGR